MHGSNATGLEGHRSITNTGPTTYAELYKFVSRAGMLSKIYTTFRQTRKGTQLQIHSFIHSFIHSVVLRQVRSLFQASSPQDAI
jgi:hypothetical protein